jgi:hypothetical protein
MDVPRGPDGTSLTRTAVRRAALITAGAGIAYGLLSIVAWVLLRLDRDILFDTDDLSGYYAQREFTWAEIAATYLLPIAAILFLWFVVALRGWIRVTRQRRNMIISDLQLVSAVAFVSLFLVGAAAAATSVVVAESESTSLSNESLVAIASFGFTLMQIMGVRLAAVFVIASASLGVTTGVMPRWFSLLSYLFGLVLMLTPVAHAALILAFPVWVIALSVILLYHIAHLAEDQIPGFSEMGADDADAPA